MEKLKERFLNFKYKGIIAIVFVYAVMSMILFLERSGIQFNYEKRRLDWLPENSIVTKTEACKS